MNKGERLEAAKKQHEYTLMEIRLSAEDVKEDMRQQINTVIKDHILPIKGRISTLEHWRTGIIAGATAIIAWFKFGHYLRGN